jgi:hypothetical protein
VVAANSQAGCRGRWLVTSREWRSSASVQVLMLLGRETCTSRVGGGSASWVALRSMRP